MSRLTALSIVLNLSFPDVRDAAYSLALGTVLFFGGVSVLVWLYEGLPFVIESLTALVGAAVMLLLAFLLFVYSWSFLAQGLTAVIAQGVRDGASRKD
jgi:hypothetical protein